MAPQTEVESFANARGQANKLPGSTADRVEQALEHCAREFFRAGDWDASLEIIRIIHDRPDCNTIGGPMLYRVGGSCPRWEGEQVDRLLLIACDGNGDFLQFGRYINEVRERCQHLTVAVEPLLHSLTLRCLPVDRVVAMHELRPALQTVDAYHPVNLLLAGTLGQRYGEPWRISPAAESVADIGPGRHVGLCWAASVSGKDRSIRFAALEPLRALHGVTFHSLQVGAAAAQAGAWVRRHELRTYDDTASLVAALDAVISVDTSVAHLAGNMGKPTHLLLCPYEDWRWGTGETTPWYPSMRLYRGNLGKAVSVVGKDLARILPNGEVHERKH
jgi:hypothetical protein